MTIRENNFRLNDVSGKWRSAKYQFDEMTFRENDVARLSSHLLITAAWFTMIWQQRKTLNSKDI